MTAQFEIGANDVVRFNVQEGEPLKDGSVGPPLRVSYRHSCCPFGWGAIYELSLDHIDKARDIAVYEVLSSRSENPNAAV